MQQELSKPRLNNRRNNLLLGWGLVLFAFAIAATVFISRFSHNQSAVPAGGSYSSPGMQ